MSYPSIWLEVSNVRIIGTGFEVQLRADREPERPRWWPIAAPAAAVPPANPDFSSQFKAVSEALEKKRPVLAELVPDGTNLKLSSLSIQYAETSR